MSNTRSRRRTKTVLDLASLLPSWEVSLRADHKSRETIKSYTTGTYQYLDWCEANGHAAAFDRELVRAWMADMLAAGSQPATVRTRQLGLRRFSAWCEAEGEIDSDPLLGLKPPKLDVKVTNSLTDDQVRALTKVCTGRSFVDRRDEAIVRLMIETGMRAGEVLALTVDDVDLVRSLVKVVRGKGGKGRIVPIGPHAARAIDRYMRARRGHRLADSKALWLGDRGKGFAYHGLRCALQDRAERAGISGFHLHLLRHTAASRWLAAGGSEGGLMAVAGWQTRDMIDRYTRSTASDRAAVEARSLNLGEF